jgi:hypothetical protein
VSLYVVGVTVACVVVVVTLAVLVIGLIRSHRTWKTTIAESAPEGFTWRYWTGMRFACCDDCRALVNRDDAEAHRTWHAELRVHQPFAS